ncbi:hypothetical protein E1H13_09660 [Nodosilinea sp. P-1105]|nr:hypothetical protein [Nodosilinea sp. P-1105]
MGGFGGEVGRWGDGEVGRWGGGRGRPKCLPCEEIRQGGMDRLWAREYCEVLRFTALRGTRGLKIQTVQVKRLFEKGQPRYRLPPRGRKPAEVWGHWPTPQV